MLAPAEPARTVHESKFSMGFVLALIAVRGHASLTDFTQSALADPALRAFQRKVEMVHDDEVETAYPARWIGLVEVETIDGQLLRTRVDAPKGDPENTLIRPEIEAKTLRLAAYGATTTSDEMRTLLARAWALESQATVRNLFAPRAAP